MRRPVPSHLPPTFLDDFDAATVPCPVSTRGSRMFPDVPVSIDLAYVDGDTYATLDMFEAHLGVRGTGAGTEAMRRILDLADKHGMTIFLDPHPLDEGWSWARLVKWYASFGFVFEEEDEEERKASANYWMMRAPHAKGARRPNPRTRRTRSRRNPDPTATPASSATKGAAFRRWFGKSKVVDAEGSPRVVYHGTAYAPGQPSITEFRGPHQPFRYPAFSGGRGKFVGVGSFFSESEEVAASYPYVSLPQTQNYTRVVHTLYLRIEKPKVYRTLRAAMEDMVTRVGPDPVAFVALLRAEGYDGITFMEGPSYAPTSAKKKARVWVAFDPRQVKSATDNAGTFDPDDPSTLRNPRTRSRR